MAESILLPQFVPPSVDLSNYALKSHSHSDYASSSHSHSGYASSGHSHPGYASSSHTHSATDISGLSVGGKGWTLAKTVPSTMKTGLIYLLDNIIITGQSGSPATSGIAYLFDRAIYAGKDLLRIVYSGSTLPTTVSVNAPIVAYIQFT